ncbi:hypothetical protein [Streptomyces sp. NRRL B-24484]|uniref:hypothetical protein n=1 Tax=Streptomyces sp. NRRL B-24484 TaxID=1463833 RepID=UPI000AF3F40D|nr:hypothetical protein [Streptomyces sp. NRRL B-24484]
MTPDRHLVEEFRSVGGASKPVISGVKVFWSEGRDKAFDLVHRLWPTEMLPGELTQILRTLRTSSRRADSSHWRRSVRP